MKKRSRRHSNQKIHIVHVVPTLEVGDMELALGRGLKGADAVLLKIQETLFPGNRMSQIVDGFRKRIGQMVNVTLERVAKIKKEGSGKYRYVVSKVIGRDFS